jgi:hypothetical protein
MGKKNFKKNIWTNGRASSIEIRANQEFKKLYRVLDTVAVIKKKRLEWIGHVLRMDQGRAVKKIFGSKPEGSRRRRRPRLRWQEDVEKDLWGTKV